MLTTEVYQIGAFRLQKQNLSLTGGLELAEGGFKFRMCCPTLRQLQQLLSHVTITVARGLPRSGRLGPLSGWFHSELRYFAVHPQAIYLLKGK